MRISPIIILLVCILAYGQDATAQDFGETIQLNQQATQSVKNGNQQTIQVVPQATRQTPKDQSIVDYAVADAQRPLPDCGCARQPYFPVSSGDLAPGSQVTINSPDQDAEIFYTTDGWTPTKASQRYTGPITINADIRLQAIAEEPNKLPSTIAEVIYTVKGSPAPKPDSVLAVGGILLKGTPLHMVTAAEVTSETAQVGDRILLVLDENVMVGESIVVPKGSSVEATITSVDRAGRAGKPGLLSFHVQSLSAHGITIPLSADLTLAAPDPAAQAQRISNPSLVHVAGTLPPGDEAEIEPGMALTAVVGADTPMHP